MPDAQHCWIIFCQYFDIVTKRCRYSDVVENIGISYFFCVCVCVCVCVYVFIYWQIHLGITCFTEAQASFKRTCYWRNKCNKLQTPGIWHSNNLCIYITFTQVSSMLSLLSKRIRLLYFTMGCRSIRVAWDKVRHFGKPIHFISHQ